jgi:hypothetical protein
VPFYQPMHSTTARLAPVRVRQALVATSSPLSEEKNDSASAACPADRKADCAANSSLCSEHQALGN